MRQLVPSELLWTRASSRVGVPTLLASWFAVKQALPSRHAITPPHDVDLVLSCLVEALARQAAREDYRKARAGRGGEDAARGDIQPIFVGPAERQVD